MEWERLGGRVEVFPDGLVIHRGKTLHGTVADPHDDHRPAMSLAVVGLRVGGLSSDLQTLPRAHAHTRILTLTSALAAPVVPVRACMPAKSLLKELQSLLRG